MPDSGTRPPDSKTNSGKWKARSLPQPVKSWYNSLALSNGDPATAIDHTSFHPMHFCQLDMHARRRSSCSHWVRPNRTNQSEAQCLWGLDMSLRSSGMVYHRYMERVRCRADRSLWKLPFQGKGSTRAARAPSSNWEEQGESACPCNSEVISKNINIRLCHNESSIIPCMPSQLYQSRTLPLWSTQTCWRWTSRAGPCHEYPAPA